MNLLTNTGIVDKEQTLRYSRLISLDSIGEVGIEKLISGRVLIVGCGALGSLCAMYLSSSGVGTLGLADFDTIDVSNLQRQLFFDETNLGSLKLEVLTDRVKAINSTVKIIEYPVMINEKRAGEIFPLYDFIIDGSDNPNTKNITAITCEKFRIPYCIGGVREFGGQVMSWSPGHSGYREIFGDIPSCNGFTPCSIAGVLGPAAGVVASVQAAEAIKYLTGAGKMLYDRLYSFDLAENRTQIFSF